MLSFEFIEGDFYLDMSREVREPVIGGVCSIYLSIYTSSPLLRPGACRTSTFPVAIFIKSYHNTHPPWRNPKTLTMLPKPVL
jgi:hypothetical protein